MSEPGGYVRQRLQAGDTLLVRDAAGDDDTLVLLG